MRPVYLSYFLAKRARCQPARREVYTLFSSAGRLAARFPVWYALRVYLKTPNAPGQRAFSRRAASFFLEIRQYSCKKMSCAARKILAAGHIFSFQIHPSLFYTPALWVSISEAFKQMLPMRPGPTSSNAADTPVSAAFCMRYENGTITSARFHDPARRGNAAVGPRLRGDQQTARGCHPAR